MYEENCVYTMTTIEEAISYLRKVALFNYQTLNKVESFRFPFWPQRVRQIKVITSSTPVMSNPTSWGYKYRTGKSASISTLKREGFHAIFYTKSGP